MRKYLMAGAAALSMAALPHAVLAQANVPGSTNTVDDKRSSYEMTGEQQTMYDAWSEQQRADYDTWPYDYQVYYWTLEPEQQEGYWVLTPEQRTRIYARTPAQRAQAWNSILQQLDAPATAAASRAPSGPASAPRGATTKFVSNEMVQGGMTATPKSEYPVCKGDVQDNCINPREAGKNWGNRPLDYWPGQPASSM